MNDTPTPGGRGPEGTQDAEPLFPSEGSFNSVVPLSEIGEAHGFPPLRPVDPADVGRPAEAAWAREAHRAKLKEEETLVPVRAGGARGARPSWVTTAAVIALSVAAGLASGTYLIWSAQRPPEPQRSPHVTAEAPTLQPAPSHAATPAPVAEKVERVNEAAEGESSDEVVKAERPREGARPAPTPRAERVTRAVEAREVTPAPRPARTQSATSSRTRPTAVVQPTQPPPSARSLPISSPPPTATSKKVIQWP